MQRKTPIQPLALLGLWVALALLSACGANAEISCTEIETGDPAAGEEIFYQTLQVSGGRAPTCVSCHNPETNAQEMVGPGLQGIGDLAPNRVPDQSAEEYLCTSIVAPQQHIVPGYPDDIILMPVTYGDTLTQEQVNDLVAYLLTLD
jgi:mono/diheme cytochrome c family protein